MKYLKLGKTDLSLKFFQKAEAVTDPANLHLNPSTRLILRAVTYNNLGCFYKSMNKLHTALRYLKKALVIEERALMNAHAQKQQEAAEAAAKAEQQENTAADASETKAEAGEGSPK